MNATDDDIGQNAEIMYALADFQPSEGQGQGQGLGRESRRLKARNDGGQGQNDGLCVEKFHIDSDIGVVTAKMRLDYEQQVIYKCRVLAVDAGEPPNTGMMPCLYQLASTDSCESCQP